MSLGRWFFIVVFALLSVSAHAVSPDFCSAMLSRSIKQEYESKPRSISPQWLTALQPELRPYSETIKKFSTWQLRPSSRLKYLEGITWSISAQYKYGPLTLELKTDSYKDEPLSATLHIAIRDNYDPLMNELYFLTTSSLSEAKVALGIEERKIVQIDTPSVTHWLNKSLGMDLWLSRIAPHYGRFGKYEKQDELVLEYVKILIWKFEAGEYSGNADWTPKTKDQVMIKTGQSFVYFRKIRSERARHSRVAINLSHYFMTEFAAITKHHPPNQRKPITYAGSFDVFRDDLLVALVEAGATLAPDFIEDYGLLVTPTSLTNFYVDVPDSAQDDPVKWTQELFERTLSKYYRH